jgi:hypothetical protein
LDATPDATVGALREFGVPDSDLAAAGLTRPLPVGGERRAGRAAPIPLDVAARALPDEPFQVNEYAALLGRHVVTTRNYLHKLIAAGWVVEIGSDPDWVGVGAAPKVYRRTRPGPALAQQPPDTEAP